MNMLTQAGVKTLFALLYLAVLLPPWAADASGQKVIDTERSVLTVRVYKAGLLSAFGHEHQIRAPIREGSFDEEKKTIEFTVDARSLRVLDSDVSDKDRAEIQSTMVGPEGFGQRRIP
jgi:hypothetical protein